VRESWAPSNQPQSNHSVMTISSTAMSVCPICSRVLPQEQLYDHLALESPRLRQNTIKLIQGYHADWVLEHGACPSCRKSFRDAGRILHMLKGAQRPGAVDY
jgi:hypothetical protein